MTGSLSRREQHLPLDDAAPPDRDLPQLAGTFEAMLGWSSGARREQLLGMRPHLDLAAAIAAESVDLAAHYGRAEPARAAEDLGFAVTQLEAMVQTLSAYRSELLALAAAGRRRQPEPDQ